MTLNWRRGLFRVWAVFSIVWAIGATAWGVTQWQSDPARVAAHDPHRCGGPTPGPWCGYQHKAPPGELTDEQVGIVPPKPKPIVASTLGWGLGVPGGIYLAASLGAWILAGFKQARS